VRKYDVSSEPTQFFGPVVNQSADFTPSDQGERTPQERRAELRLAADLGKENDAAISLGFID
jgi:hypothetical protein